ncbi:hypothetical protein LZ30DRAFT_744158 [Colletotrichum cereale]|nr:hypothetical protein LZ30DRAFT_744158 [Colletotrichum cereale]
MDRDILFRSTEQHIPFFVWIGYVGATLGFCYSGNTSHRSVGDGLGEEHGDSGRVENVAFFPPAGSGYLT